MPSECCIVGVPPGFGIAVMGGCANAVLDLAAASNVSFP
jgi:hypothetical protein